MTKIDTNIKQSQSNKKNLIISLFGAGLLLICAISYSAYLWNTNWDLAGLDVWGHIFKSDILYDNINNGNMYPLYSEKWYNGIQLYRYWPPLTYYLMAFFEFFTDGDPIAAYYIFTGFVIFVGGLPFIMLGKRLNKPVTGIICAFLWFGLPDNIRVFFIEGNMPRIMTTVIIPYLIYFLYRFLRENKKSALIGLMLTMTLLTFTHLMITAIIGIGTFIFLVFDVISTKEYVKDIVALVAMVIGIMIAGIWFVPAMFGGMLAMGDSSSGVQDILTFNLSESLNTLNRVVADSGLYYFGIGVLIVAIFGLMLAKKGKAGFSFAIFVLLGSTPATVSIIKHIPLGDFLWMTRFTALAYGYFLFSILEWKTIKKKYAMIFVGLVMLDSMVSVACIPNYYTPAQAPAETVRDGQILKEMTKNRASVVDLSEFGCYLSWQLVNGDDGVDYTFGWAWQGATTAQNIMLLNEGLEHEEYIYIFDRSIELGNDSVLIKKARVKQEDKMIEAASLLGYELVDETDSGYFFSLNRDGQFGVKTTYEGLSIGQYSSTMTVFFPKFTIGSSEYIDDYSVEELSEYKTLFLSGFKYHDECDAINLIKEVSDNGVRVVIDVDHIPENSMKQKKFMGVIENEITLEKNFPNLLYKDSAIINGKLPADYETWKTGYVANVDNVLGYINDSGNDIPFLSYNDEEPNIYYMGLNIAYLGVVTNSQDIWNILADVFGIGYNDIPDRKIVPIDIQFSDKEIVIKSEETDVNTTLAYQDIFESEQSISNSNNLLVVGDNEVVITMNYPHFNLALITSIVGIIAGIGFMAGVYKYKEYL